MKKIFQYYSLFALAIYISLPALPQSPNWLWAKRAGGTSIDYATDVATDALGNTYITGTYNSAPIIFGSNALTNSGLTDIFLVKYDVTGNILWARRAGNSDSEFGQSVATDAAGNVYIAGAFSTSIVFGTTTLTSAGSTDIYVSKYDSAGNVLWAKRAGGPGGDGANCIAVTAAGDVYIGGSYNSASLTFGSNTLPNYGFNDGFVAKYNTAGTALWGRNIGEYLDEFVSDIATDAAGNVYVAGIYNSLDVVIGSSVVITNNQDAVDDIFLAKFNASGTLLWARGAGGWEGDYAYGITADVAGNVYITGYFVSNPVTFGSITLTSGAFSLYLAKYNSAGTIQWVVSPGYGIGYGLTIDVCGDIYWTGEFGSNITFGSTTLNYAGQGDVFVAKYSTAGSPLWAMHAGGTNHEAGKSIALNPANNHVLVAGHYSSSSLTFGATTLTNANVDGFVAQLDETCVLNVLPIELLSFTGRKAGVINILEWTTASEINNDYFTIQRSKTGDGFEDIGIIKGAGNSNEIKKYNFTDINPLSGLNYYRLMQTDFDGIISYSEIIYLNNKFNNELIIYPNVVTDFIYILKRDETEKFEAVIFDEKGKTILRVNNAGKIDVTGLADGIYFIKLIFEGKIVINKFVKTELE